MKSFKSKRGANNFSCDFRWNFLLRAIVLISVINILGLVKVSSAVDETPFGWESKPVIVNVQVDLGGEEEQQAVYNILDEVEEHNGHATVFVTGEFSSLHPDIIRGIEARGHEIAVHGWRNGEDISVLSPNEQLALIQSSFSAVRSAVEKPENVVDFKPQGYKFNIDTIRVLQEFGARSISGLFPCDESFCRCWYAQSLGKITFPYPVTTEFWAVPISEVKIDANDVPLDDACVDNSSDYFNYLVEKYNRQIQTKDPLIIVVHPSITGADEAWFSAFSRFLTYVQSNNGKIAGLGSFCHFTTYITNFNATGPTDANVGEQITINVTYTSNIWCPYYRFLMYGKYPGEEWCLLDVDPVCEFVYTGPHSFSRQFKIPKPPRDENTYTVRVVGRATFGGCPPIGDLQYWPNYENYDVVDEIEVEVKRKCVTVINNGDPSTKLDIVFVGDDYTENELKTFASDVDTHISEVLSYEPFASNLSKINVCRLDVVEDLECHYNCGGIDRLICCNASKVTKLASSCPVDQIIVLVNNNQYGGGGYTCAGIAVAYRGDGRVTTHEFGHSFGCLHDHYPSDPSCEKYKCMMCSLNYPFATSPCTCRQELINKLNAYQTVPEVTSDKIYVMDLNYDKGNITLLNVFDKIGYAPDRKIQPETGYSCEVISFLDEVLYYFKFLPPTTISPPPPLPCEGCNGTVPDETVQIENIDFTLLLPYLYNGKFINIYNPDGQLLLSVDVSQYASAGLNGAVADYSGVAVANAFIQVSGTSHASTFADENGDYEVVEINPGSYIVSVTPDPYNNLMPTSTSATLSTGETTTCDFVLNPAGGIGGIVTDVNGNPVPNVRLYLSGYETPQYATDEEGEYIIPALQAGTQTINIEAPGYGSWYIFVNGTLARYAATSVSVEVTLGQTTWVDFTQQQPPMPDIRVEPNSFELSLVQGETADRLVTIGNDGNDILEFEVTDGFGSLITDPSEWDLSDIKQVFASLDSTNVNFTVETYSPIPSYAWFYSYIWLDTDQNHATGVTEDWWPGMGLNDIGADYVLGAEISAGYSYGYLYRWTTGGYFEFVSYIPIVLNDAGFSVSIPLSDIADEGLLDFTLWAESSEWWWYYDIAPDSGHGTTLVAVDWLSESPTSGTANPSEQAEVTVTIDTSSLQLGDYDACIVVNSNDLDEGVIYIPVHLTVIEPAAVDNLVSKSVGTVSYDRRTGQFSANVTVKNTSATVVNSPVWLVIESISNPAVTLAGADGTTAGGKPYLDLSGLLGDGKLSPAESITKRLYFNNPGRVQFTFKPSVRGVILP